MTVARSAHRSRAYDMAVRLASVRECDSEGSDFRRDRCVGGIRYTLHKRRWTERPRRSWSVPPAMSSSRVAFQNDETDVSRAARNGG
jgi:hypothetical protein